MRQRRQPEQQQVTGDQGFSLVEAVVALGIATAVFTALAFALIGGAKTALLSQQNQHAGDLLNKTIEDLRALSYDDIAMRQVDLDAGEAPRSPTIASCSCYNPTNDSTSGTGVEDLMPVDPNGAIDEHVKTTEQNGGVFTIRRYITSPVEARTDPAVPASATFKRATVVVTWTSRGTERKRVATTLISPTKRGLPLPDFKFTNVGSLSQCRNPGSSAVYSFSLKNNGARDAWNLAPAPTAPGWTFYDDRNSDGALDAGDVALTGSPTSTGLIEPTAERRLLAQVTLADAATQPPPYTLSTTFRATSAAQPTYFQELVAVTAVQATPCGAVAMPTPTASPSPSAPPPAAPAQPAASCDTLTGAASASAPSGTLINYYPFNPAQPGDTAASTDMPLQRDAGTAPAVGPLYNYSTDLHSAAGRKLMTGTGAIPSQVASWTYAMPATSELKGTGAVTFYAAVANGVTTSRPAFSLKLDLLTSTGSVVSTVASAVFTAPAAGWGCAGFQRVAVSLSSIGGSGVQVLANQKLRLSIRETGGVDVLLAYGTAAYPSTFTLPYKNGLG